MTAARSEFVSAEPGCVSAEEAFRKLGIDRTTGYRAIKDGTFPLPIIRVGRLIKVPVAALHRLLAGQSSGYNSVEETDGRTA